MTQDEFRKMWDELQVELAGQGPDDVTPARRFGVAPEIEAAKILAELGGGEKEHAIKLDSDEYLGRWNIPIIDIAIVSTYSVEDVCGKATRDDLADLIRFGVRLDVVGFTGLFVLMHERF